MKEVKSSVLFSFFLNLLTLFLSEYLKQPFTEIYAPLPPWLANAATPTESAATRNNPT